MCERGPEKKKKQFPPAKSTSCIVAPSGDEVPCPETCRRSGGIWRHHRPPGLALPLPLTLPLSLVVAHVQIAGVCPGSRGSPSRCRSLVNPLIPRYLPRSTSSEDPPWRNPVSLSLSLSFLSLPGLKDTHLRKGSLQWLAGRQRPCA